MKCNKNENQEDCPNFNPDLNPFQRCGNQLMGNCTFEPAISDEEKKEKKKEEEDYSLDDLYKKWFKNYDIWDNCM